MKDLQLITLLELVEDGTLVGSQMTLLVGGAAFYGDLMTEAEFFADGGNETLEAIQRSSKSVIEETAKDEGEDAGKYEAREFGRFIHLRVQKLDGDLINGGIPFRFRLDAVTGWANHVPITV